MPEYETSDLSIAATLCTMNHDLIRIEDTTYQKRKKFVFEKTARLDTDLGAYWDNDLLVNPRLLLDNIRNIKARIVTY